MPGSDEVGSAPAPAIAADISVEVATTQWQIELGMARNHGNCSTAAPSVERNMKNHPQK